MKNEPEVPLPTAIWLTYGTQSNDTGSLARQTTRDNHICPQKQLLATNRHHSTNLHACLLAAWTFSVFLIHGDRKEMVVHVETHPRMAVLYPQKLLSQKEEKVLHYDSLGVKQSALNTLREKHGYQIQMGQSQACYCIY